MADLAVFCVEAVDGVPVEPCGSYQGVAMAPMVAPTAGATAIDAVAAGEVFAWALTLVLVPYVIGIVIGAILKVIRTT